MATKSAVYPEESFTMMTPRPQPAGAFSFGGTVKEFLVSWKDAAPAIAAITAIISAFVALGVFIYTRKANRRRATLDMVMRTLLDEVAQKKYSEFKKIVRKSKDASDPLTMASLVDSTEANNEDRTIVLYQLNIYELTSLGIRRGTFDEGFYLRWFHNQFMTDFENAQDFIKGAQDQKVSVYCEFTALYNRWYKTGHPVSSPNRFKLVWLIMRGKWDDLDNARALSRAR